MFQKGEYIMYGSTGVCRVEDVAVPDNIPMKDEVVRYEIVLAASIKIPEFGYIKPFSGISYFLQNGKIYGYVKL